MQLLDHVELALGQVALSERLEDSLAELIGAGGRRDHHGSGIAGRLDVAVTDGDGDGGVGITQIALLGIEVVDRRLGGVLVGIAAAEHRLYLLLDAVVNGIHAVLLQRVHVTLGLGVVVAGHGEQQALEVRADEDIHRRGYGGIEIAVLIIYAGVDEIREDVVGVGCADELIDRQTHFIGVVAGEDIAEVAGRDGDVDLLAEGDLPRVDHIAVGGNIVYDLRQQAAPVDGVRRAEHHAVLLEDRVGLGIGEDALDGGLGVVKVAADGTDVDVLALLGIHLMLLHRGHAVDRIENDDLRMRNVAEALERRLAGIAGGRHEDDGVLAVADLRKRLGQEMRQYLQRHVLERAGGAVPELQQIHFCAVIGNGRERSGILSAELRGGIGGIDAFGDLLRGEIGEIHRDDELRPLAVIHREHRAQRFGRELREALGHEQSAVLGDALCDRLCGRNGFTIILSGMIQHHRPS